MTKIFIFSLFLAIRGLLLPDGFPAFGGVGPVPPDSSGIEGHVYSVSGNRMPSPGHQAGPLPAVGSTRVYIFELTNISQVARVGQSPYYSAVHTRLVQEATTDSAGYFRVFLPAGRYSVFTKKNGLFYASRFDTRSNIAPVEVVPGKMTQIDCQIEGDRKPVY